MFRLIPKKILAIDADSAAGMSTALGIDVKTTIDVIRKEIIETIEDGQTKSAIELTGDARHKNFDALVETDGFAFIAVSSFSDGYMIRTSSTILRVEFPSQADMKSALKRRTFSMSKSVSRRLTSSIIACVSVTILPGTKLS